MFYDKISASYGGWCPPQSPLKSSADPSGELMAGAADEQPLDLMGDGVRHKAWRMNRVVGDGVMVARQILDLSVLVRIQVPQPFISISTRQR